MLADLTSYDFSAPIEADLCIAGAGVAGISIALEFINVPNLRVVVLEGGDLEFTDQSQEIYQGKIIGRDYHPLDVTRLRYFGGSSNHWGGMCRPLDAIDFEQREWVQDSGWPIAQEALAAYWPRAHEILDIGDPSFDLRQLGDREADLLALEDDRLLNVAYRHSRLPLGGGIVHLGEKYRDELRSADNVQVFLNANVRDIRLNGQGSQVTEFEVTDLSGRSLNASARAFILALGGLENPRLLLNANKQNPNGVGNDNGLVGHYFMDHIMVPSGSVVVNDGYSETNVYAETAFLDDGAGMTIGIAGSPKAQRQNRTLNHVAQFEFHTLRGSSKGYAALRRLRRNPLDQFLNNTGDLLADLDSAVVGTFNRLRGVTAVLSLPANVETWSEQAPNPESRVLLNDDIDRLGLRRISLDWRLSELDKHTIQVGNRILAEEFGRLGWARFKLADWLLEEDPNLWPDDLEGLHHHMGTTRMSDEPTTGVVDADCAVHGVDNLFVAGSSVFPTGGFANPTLTITHLSLRLAEHLKSRLA
jgi:choline dehydrogenase-like flavoprotein